MSNRIVKKKVFWCGLLCPTGVIFVNRWSVRFSTQTQQNVPNNFLRLKTTSYEIRIILISDLRLLSLSPFPPSELRRPVPVESFLFCMVQLRKTSKLKAPKSSAEISPESLEVFESVLLVLCLSNVKGC
jgi:hypothetical protein